MRMPKPAWVLVLLSLVVKGPAPAQAQAPAPNLDSVPASESKEAAALIDRAATTLAGGKGPADILTDPAFMDAHQWTRFRKLIATYSTGSRTAIVTPSEPGPPLHVTGSVKKADGSPLAGALVYVYQTSSEGWYSAKAPHISGMGGDTDHARLFGYMTSDARGEFEFRTIHPKGYPGSDLPAHIHIQVTPAGGSHATLVSEILFDDDPRLTPPVAELSRREGFRICHVHVAEDGGLKVRAEFTVP